VTQLTRSPSKPVRLNGDGNRLQASTGSLASQKTNYLWDTNFNLPQLALERDGNNALLRGYTYGTRRIAMTTGGSSYYYQYDPLGSVSNLTSATGATEWTYSYEPFGSMNGSPIQNDPNAPANFVKFAAQYNDPTGFYFLRARQLDSASGRFTRIDPLAGPMNKPEISAYAYVGDRATTLVDPSGETLEPNNDAQSWTTEVGSPDEGANPQQVPAGDAAAERQLASAAANRPQREYNKTLTTPFEIVPVLGIAAGEPVGRGKMGIHVRFSGRGPIFDSTLEVVEGPEVVSGILRWTCSGPGGGCGSRTTPALRATPFELTVSDMAYAEADGKYRLKTTWYFFLTLSPPQLLVATTSLPFTCSKRVSKIAPCFYSG
jgi:RHS repeat-associated protein